MTKNRLFYGFLMSCRGLIALIAPSSIGNEGRQKSW
jgi:hypothetical protein